MSVDIVVKKMIRIDGREYESLDQVPQEDRAAVVKALPSASGLEELPAVLRGIVQAAVEVAAKHGTPEAKEEARAEQEPPHSIQTLRPEPVISPRVVAALALLVLMFLLVRYVF